MNRKIKLLSSLIGVTTIFSSLSSLVSCATNPSIDEIVTVDNKSITTKEHNFEIGFSFAFDIHSQVYIQMLDETRGIRVSEKVFNLDGRNGKIKLSVLDTIHQNTSFTFNLKFWYIGKDGSYRNYTIYNFFVYFVENEIVDLDYVYLEEQTKEITNTHVCTYRMLLDHKPQSNVEMTLLNDSFNCLSLEKESFEVKPYGDTYIFDFNILLDISVFSTKSIPFDLFISFTNSYGVKQTQYFYGCTLRFVKEATEEMPDDYFDIRETQNGKKELVGLKEGISRAEGGKYTILSIPKEVEIIKERAFDNDYRGLLKNINSIQINNKVEDIGFHAFGCMNKLCEIDLTDYGSAVPKWIDSQNLFANINEFNYVSGFVWTNRYSDLESLHQKMIGWGLPEHWLPLNSDSVSTPNDFTYQDDTKKVLTGINEERKEHFKKIKVIKIPETVTEISGDAFKELKTLPYEKTNPTEDYLYETRRLILNHALKTLSKGVFQDCGIGGPVMIYCDDLEDIPINAFSNMQNYGWPGMWDVEKEDMYLFFVNSLNVNTIQRYSFNYVPFNGVCHINKSVSYIGDAAFQGNQFNAILFENNVTTVGAYSFANIYSATATPQLKTIDFTCYDKPFNPTAKKEDWEYIPSWMNNNDFAFLGSCQPTGKVILSSQIINELNAKGTYDTWVTDFKNNHGIPEAWTVE